MALTVSIGALLLAGLSWAGDRTPVLIELFTSEGCSSCPAADRLLVQLQDTQPIEGAEIIALSEHVDYWNDHGWTDPYSSPTFTRRQSVYAVEFRQSSVYTPQMIVDGKDEFVGGDRSSAERAIRRAITAPKARIRLRALADESSSPPRPDALQFEIEIDGLSKIKNGGRADLFLALTEDHLNSAVDGGENAGRSLGHSCVVRMLHPIEEIKGAPKRVVVTSPVVRIRDDWQRENLRAVAFLQDRDSHRVLGVGTLDLLP
jgi:hypothetical protein